MELDDIQKPNIGTPEYATGRSSGERKIWAIVCTVAFAVFWFSGLYTAAALFGQGGLGALHWSGPVLAVLGFAVGMVARSRVDAG